eukprot:SAG31_NODE_14101_length_827_cov_1.056319_1_plen_32_part_10
MGRPTRLQVVVNVIDYLNSPLPNKYLYHLLHL